MSDIRKIAEERADKKMDFYDHLKVYVIVNAILAVINALFSPEFWWVLFPIFFWGIGIIVDYLTAFVFTGHLKDEDYRERKIQEEMDKLRK